MRHDPDIHQGWRDEERALSVARGLGWFSLALGAAELLAPRVLDRAIGVGRHESLTRAYGAREVAAGVGILAAEDPEPWVWARVAGDMLDLASLAPSLSPDNPDRARTAFAFGNVALATALDVACALALRNRPPRRAHRRIARAF